jgi:2-polyprenyl-3-methyl-5-hydroxy-6-metoxy-1,4-benzoquinol methylase
MSESRGGSLSLSGSPTEAALTARQRRERAYYDEYARRTAPDELKFHGILGTERRPWNPYWSVIELVRNARIGDGQMLLDFGCGPGTYSLTFAKLGYRVFGFDISPVNVEAASRLAAKYGLADRAHFTQGIAERLDYPDDSFDVVVGIDILHHVDFGASIRETVRVLKPGGIAIFKEPIEAPLFDGVRNTRLGRWLAPKDVSFERHLTADERKLNRDDLATIHRLAPCAAVSYFRLLCRLDVLTGSRFRWKGASVLEMFDSVLLRQFQSLNCLAGAVVFVIRRPVAPGRSSMRGALGEE